VRQTLLNQRCILTNDVGYTMCNVWAELNMITAFHLATTLGSDSLSYSHVISLLLCVALFPARHALVGLVTLTLKMVHVIARG